MNSHPKDLKLENNFEDIEDFVEHISKELTCPITIEDANHRLIAYSTHDDRTDPARVATIIGRRVPDRVINSLWKHGVIPSLLKSEKAIRVKKIDEIGLGDRVAISILDNNHEVIGYIWTLEIERPLEDSELIFLEKAALVAKKYLIQLHNRKNKKEEGRQEIFWQLLTGHIKKEIEINKKLISKGITPPSYSTVIVFHFPNEINASLENQIDYLLITQQLNIHLYTIDLNNLILLASPFTLLHSQRDVYQYIDTFVNQMKEKMDLSVIGSYGGLYNGVENIEESYKEALTVLEIKDKFSEETNTIHNYQDLGIYQFLDVLLEKRKKDRYQNPTLLKLKEYDKQHGSQLLETLEVYINKDNNFNEAAKALHIHVNTLNYRLKRITEIGQIDLKNPNQKIALYLDLKMERYR